MDDVGVVLVFSDAPTAYPVDNTVITWSAADAAGNIGHATQLVRVIDTTPPNVVFALDVHELWPPNHKLHEIGVTVSATDIVDAIVSVSATAVSTETDDAKGNGDGKTTGDIRSVDPNGESTESSNDVPEVVFDPVLDQLYLRAERAGGGGDRYYAVTVMATDGSGNRAVMRDSVYVAHDNRVAKRVASVPVDYELLPNAPNPFNPSTLIRFTLPEATGVQLELFDVLGRSVRVLSEGVFPAGFHVREWNGTDASGHQVASGIYFARFKAGEYRAIRRMLLLR